MKASPSERLRATGFGSYNDLAMLLGVTVQAVKKATAEGRVTREENGWFHLARASAQWRGNSVGSANGGGATPLGDGDDSSEAPAGGESFAAARTRKEIALADQAEMKASESRGELVSVAEAERLWFDVARSTRSRVMALPDLLSGRMSGMTRAQIRTLLDSELRTALADLPDAMPVRQ